MSDLIPTLSSDDEEEEVALPSTTTRQQQPAAKQQSTPQQSDNATTPSTKQEPSLPAPILRAVQAAAIQHGSHRQQVPHTLKGRQTVSTTAVQANNEAIPAKAQFAFDAAEYSAPITTPSAIEAIVAEERKSSSKEGQLTTLQQKIQQRLAAKKAAGRKTTPVSDSDSEEYESDSDSAANDAGSDNDEGWNSSDEEAMRAAGLNSDIERVDSDSDSEATIKPKKQKPGAKPVTQIADTTDDDHEVISIGDSGDEEDESDSDDEQKDDADSNTIVDMHTESQKNEVVSDSSAAEPESDDDNLRLKQRNVNKRQKLNENTTVIQPAQTITRTAGTAPTHTSFATLSLSRPLMRAIQDLKWTAPTHVQSETIPVALEGHDCLVNAQTGSGKTAAFVLPCLERLLYQAKRIAVTRILILSPTRELAAQTHDTIVGLCKYTNIRVSLVVGGLSEKQQLHDLLTRPDIIVATPGRLVDHLHNSASFHIDDVEVLIIDEADRMLELEFSDEVREIVRSVPARGRQTMLFSATLSETVNDLVELSLQKPVRITVDPYEQVVDRLQQEFIRLRPSDPEQLLAERYAIVLALAKRTFTERTIIFCSEKVQCHRLALIFGFAGLQAAELHGNLSQQQRMQAIESFKNQQVQFLLATDVAARGIDIPNVLTVINMALPRQLRAYVHRVGRTARAGQSGRSCSLVAEHDRPMLKLIMKKASEVIVSRSVARPVIDKYLTAIADMEEDIRAVTEDERVERGIRLAEMEANKARNMIEHKDEIFSRPKKEWIISGSAKKEVQNKAERLFEQPTPSAQTADSSLQAQWKAEKDKKAKKDPFAGMSREQRRRKQAQMEADKERKREAQLNAADTDGEARKSSKPQKVDVAKQALIEGKRAKRALAAGALTQQQAPKKRARNDDGAGDDDAPASGRRADVSHYQTESATTLDERYKLAGKRQATAAKFDAERRKFAAKNAKHAARSKTRHVNRR